jgi:protein required for attachment to host cells
MELTGKIAGKNLNALRGGEYVAGPHPAPRVWIIAADKHIARVFSKESKELDLIGEIAPRQEILTELTNRSVGRTVSAGDPSIRHKYEPHMNESRQESLAFVHDLADWLKRMEGEHVFDRLILAAPPEILGDLRAVLGKAVRSRVIAEIDKDLTKFNDRELWRELETISLPNF